MAWALPPGPESSLHIAKRPAIPEARLQQGPRKASQLRFVWKSSQKNTKGFAEERQGERLKRIGSEANLSARIKTRWLLFRGNHCSPRNSMVGGPGTKPALVPRTISSFTACRPFSPNQASTCSRTCPQTGQQVRYPFRARIAWRNSTLLRGAPGRRPRCREWSLRFGVRLLSPGRGERRCLPGEAAGRFALATKCRDQSPCANPFPGRRAVLRE